MSATRRKVWTVPILFGPLKRAIAVAPLPEVHTGVTASEDVAAVVRVVSFGRSTPRRERVPQALSARPGIVVRDVSLYNAELDEALRATASVVVSITGHTRVWFPSLMRIAHCVSFGECRCG